ncbi:thioredoxin reductase (NADPH) [Alteribacillus persepolensis]|uniref:Ferredoxin--NADP reductase n=1 Tax=Alteribacillus persepolensis TaxID=568899 RepID=A0A1G8EDM8_9BACI|nr:NAD(P)/FAD-dependent oxidoreductase [Alteribacillus persepolensis]SDH67971.1 thioredoxin reductase (NADPH) [Alteribacillus persepolensis]
MKEHHEKYDITIIGGGPAGLFTAFYAGLRQMSVKIIESLPQLGGQLAALYPEKYIYDVAGFPKVKAQELVNQLLEQANYFNPAVCVGEMAETLETLEDGTIKLTTNRGEHYTKTVVLTAGNGAFRPRKLQLDEAVSYEDQNLHYFIKDLNQFKGKNVVIFGGGDSAVDWSLMLEPLAKSVTLIHRREKFRAHEHSIKQLFSSGVNIKTPYVPYSIRGNSNGIQEVVIQHSKEEDELQFLEVDDVIVNFGFIASLGPMKEWGLEIEKNSIVVNSKMETNIPGVYAAGDICTYDGKVKLIATGFGEAPVAVSNAKSCLDPKAKLQPQHSTSIFA